MCIVRDGGSVMTPMKHKCKLCQDTGWHSYGFNLSKPCASCCTHDEGWWELTEQYEGYEDGQDNACCLNGCGTMRRELVTKCSHLR